MTVYSKAYRYMASIKQEKEMAQKVVFPRLTIVKITIYSSYIEFHMHVAEYHL